MPVQFKPSRNPVYPEQPPPKWASKFSKPLKKAWESSFGGCTIESTDCKEKAIVDLGYNALYASIISSHNLHVPLILYPDAIWIQIVQQLAIHIKGNVESLRDTFVDFQGKKVLTVRRDNFVKGDFNNPWENVFPEFAEQIRDFIGDDNYKTIVSEFTTTTPASKAAQEIALMDCAQPYFDFLLRSRCGIPRITLEGEREDWQGILDKTKKLAKYGLHWWLNELVPVLQEFVRVFDNDINFEFWESFVNIKENSGGPFFTGHMTKFSAYRPVHQDETTRRRSTEGFELAQTEFKRIVSWKGSMTTRCFTSGLSMVPFLWEYYATTYPMTFSSGHQGFEIVNGVAFRPNISWAVIDRELSPSDLQAEVDRFAKELARDQEDKPTSAAPGTGRRGITPQKRGRH